MGLGNDLGKEAAREIHASVTEGLGHVASDVIPAAQRAADEVVTVATGAIERAAGALCTALGSLPESITSAFDGLTVTISEIKITVSRKPNL